MATFNYNNGNFSGSLDDNDLKLWFNEFVGHDNISLFIGNIIVNKDNKLFKRMQNEWTPKLMNDSSVSAISASKNDFVNQVLSQPSYQNASASSAS